MFVISSHGMRTAAIVLALLGATPSPQDPGPRWPQFRGPGARGVAETATFPDRWSATENVEWKAELPGRGWSSPIVWGNRIFLTTVVSQAELEAPKKGLYFGGDRPQPPRAAQEWWASCLDLASGKTLWKQKVHEGESKGSIHIKNSFASETPVTDGERVYFYFGNLGLFVFDLEGKEVWTKKFEAQRTRNGWGPAASPVLHGDRIYLVNDNEEKSWLLALEKRTGKEIWRVERDEKSNWATPYVWENSRRAEIITPGTGKVRAYDLDGKLLWWLSGMSGITIATPFAEGDLLYVTSGYVGSPLRPIYAIKPGGEGDLSLAKDATSGASIAWCDWRAAPYNPSTLLYQGRLTVLLDRGALSAYDAKTGKPLFEREKIPDGRGFSASPWAAQGKIYALNEDGVTFVFKAGDTFELLHSNRLADDDMGMATPAIAGDRLVLRTSARIYCIRAAAK
jgi:outer membrane protein assembly factor BamB